MSAVKFPALATILAVFVFMVLVPAQAAPLAKPEYYEKDSGETEVAEEPEGMYVAKTDTITRKNVSFPDRDLMDTPAFFTYKTTKLLDEAMAMLKKVNKFPDHQWLEDYVIRLKFLAHSLKTSMQSVEERSVMKLSPKDFYFGVPDGISTVSPTGIEKKPNAYPEFHVQSKFVIKSQKDMKRINEATNDELVKELESLHSIKAPGSSGKLKKATGAEKMKKSNGASTKKKSIYEDMLQIVDGQRHPYSPNPQSTINNIENTEGNKDTAESGENQIGREEPKRRIQHPNTEVALKWNPNVMSEMAEVNPANDQPSHQYFNESLNGMHMHLPHNQKELATHLQNQFLVNPSFNHLRHHGIQGAIQKLQRPGYPNQLRKQKYFKGINVHHNEEYKNWMMDGHPNKQFIGQNDFYKPHPPVGKAEKNGGEDASSTPQPNQQFSEEMKRELRDGKVILVSDNVVRSHFPDAEDKEAIPEKNGN